MAGRLLGGPGGGEPKRRCANHRRIGGDDFLPIATRFWVGGFGQGPVRRLLKRLIDLRLTHARLIEWHPPPSMSQHERGHPTQVIHRGHGPLLPGCQGRRRPTQHDICAHTFSTNGQRHVTRHGDDVERHISDPNSSQAEAQLTVVNINRQHRSTGLGRQLPLHHRHPEQSIRRRRHLNGQTETVEQLRSQLTLFRVHGANEHEPGRVTVGHTIALHPVDARNGHVEERVDEMVGQQVDLIHVQHPAMSRRQQAGSESGGSVSQQCSQVDGAQYAILGGPQRQLHERSTVGQQCCQATGQRRLGRPFLTS